MTDNLAKLLERLVRDRRALQVREQRHARQEQQMIDSLRHLLPQMGYRVIPAGGPGRPGAAVATVLKPKRLRCPKCERRFAHPLPMARHLKATHGVTLPSKARRAVSKSRPKLRKSA